MKAIQPNELRIGNLFKDREGRICKVESINEDFEECDILSTEGAITALPIEPIPLTEEWLVRFGFEKDSIISEDDSYSFKGELVFIGETGIRYFGLTTILKYVHQLQNLYFAITGEELNFEL